MKIPHGKVCQFTRITTTGMNVSLTEHYIPVNYFIIYYIIIYLLHHIQTGKTTPIRRTDVREAGVSRHQGAPNRGHPPWNPSDHHSTIVLRGSRAAPMMPRDASLSDSRCKFFQSGTKFYIWVYVIYLYIIYTYMLYIGIYDIYPYKILYKTGSRARTPRSGLQVGYCMFHCLQRGQTLQF